MKLKAPAASGPHLCPVLSGRGLVSVGRSETKKFIGLCEVRSVPVLRIGVADNSGELELQNIANWHLGELGAAHKGTLAELFG